MLWTLQNRKKFGLGEIVDRKLTVQSLHSHLRIYDQRVQSLEEKERTSRTNRLQQPFPTEVEQTSRYFMRDTEPEDSA